MIRKFICFSLSFILCFLLCGCDLLTSDTAKLLSPPSLSGDLKPIAKAIDDSVQTPYVFKYPSRGDYRSAVVRKDLNRDGLLEAFAFYSTTDGETVTMNLNFICLINDKWKSVSTQQLVAGGVDKIDFCDLDNDGTLELLVGWEIYGVSEMQLAIYSFAENTLSQRMLKQYTHFTTCDLNEDSEREVLLIYANTAESINTAALYTLAEEGVTELSSCELDSAAKTINPPVISTLSSGKPAVYLDEIKGVGAITEVLFMEKGNLVNPFFQAESRETVATLRSANFAITDMNSDGIYEIPVQRDVPSVTLSQLNEKLYLTEWCTFNGRKLIPQTTTMINVNDGFIFTIPPKWINNIAILKDTDKRIREIYRYNPKETVVSDSLVYFEAVDKSDWKARKFESKNMYKITSTDNTVFVCKVSDAAKKDGITLEWVKNNFKIYEQE